MDFPMAMPDELRIQDDPVQAYRNYYNRDKSLYGLNLRLTKNISHT